MLMKQALLPTDPLPQPQVLFYEDIKMKQFYLFSLPPLLPALSLVLPPEFSDSQNTFLRGSDGWPCLYYN